jgi:hypothetical protein
VYELTAYFYVDSALQGWFVTQLTGMKHEASRAPVLYDGPEHDLLIELINYIRTGKPISAGSLKQFGYPEGDFAQAWDAVSGLDLICGKNVL